MGPRKHLMPKFTELQVARKDEEVLGVRSDVADTGFVSVHDSSATASSEAFLWLDHWCSYR